VAFGVTLVPDGAHLTEPTDTLVSRLKQLSLVPQCFALTTSAADLRQFLASIDRYADLEEQTLSGYVEALLQFVSEAMPDGSINPTNVYQFVDYLQESTEALTIGRFEFSQMEDFQDPAGAFLPFDTGDQPSTGADRATASDDGDLLFRGDNPLLVGFGAGARHRDAVFIACFGVSN
jgi:hypothetical protein